MSIYYLTIQFSYHKREFRETRVCYIFCMLLKLASQSKESRNKLLFCAQIIIFVDLFVTYQMSMNRGITTTTQSAHASLLRSLLFIIFLSWRRA